jgi:NTP pyrophosphatase (non-canonical NTP hydrolase)
MGYDIPADHHGSLPRSEPRREPDMRFEHALREAAEELKQATRKFGSFHSTHEGFAVLKEEVDELWDEVKKNGTPGQLRAEAKQVAAMALRFMIDLT